MPNYQYKFYDPSKDLSWTNFYKTTGKYTDWRTNLNLKDEIARYKDDLINNYGLSEKDYNDLINGPIEANEDFYHLMYWQYLKNERQRLNDELRSGGISGLDYQGEMSGLGLQLSPEEASYMNNIISLQEAERQNEVTEELRDSSITSAANQYTSLGLNPASVIRSGGVSAGGVASADMSSDNTGMFREQLKQRDFDRKASMAQTLLGITGKMAASGIGGASYGLARKAVSMMASQTANSARSIIKDKGHEDDPDSWYIF